MRVLLIEPDRLLGGTYVRALTRAGHEVVACPGAQQAIEAADNQCPDVVVMELQLVSHSGIEFLYEFRSYTDWMNVPVIVHTHVPPGEFADARAALVGELGIGTYLYKPYTTLDTLLRTVGEIAPVA